MKKNGFIATSLIYSFFLVFLAIIMALLSSYMANKTILDRYNEKAMEKLNGETYKVRVYVKNAFTTSGVTLNNLITDGNFSNGIDSWTKVGDASYATSAVGLSKTSNVSSATYLSQEIINIEGNHKYYYTITYRQPNYTGTLKTYFSDASSLALSTSQTQNYKKVYKQIKYNSGGNKTFILGYANTKHEAVFIKDVMVLDLTASYGSGNEPPVDWINENVKWINGSSRFIYQDGIEKGTTFSLSMNPYEGYNNNTTNCYDDAGASVPYTISNNKLVINNISKNVTCDVEWGA